MFVPNRAARLARSARPAIGARLALLCFALLMAGCTTPQADDDARLDDAGGRPDATSPGATAPEEESQEEPAPPEEPETEAPPEPIRLEGSVDDASTACTASKADGHAEVQGAPTGTGSLHGQDLPAEAWGRAYTLTVSADGEPITGVGGDPIKVCIKWGQGAVQEVTSGTVPEGAERVAVGADGAFGVSYVIEIV